MRFVPDSYSQTVSRVLRHGYQETIQTTGDRFVFLLFISVT